MFRATLLVIAATSNIDYSFPTVALGAAPTAIFDSRDIDESSGIVMSRQYRGIFWTHNDSGDLPRLFAVRANGQFVAQVGVKGAENIDWEDIANDDQGHLYICDIGNNMNRRSELTIYVIDEPNPFTQTSARLIQRVDYRYPDQSRFPDLEKFNFDAEACFWGNGSLYILTKHRSDPHTKLYRLNLFSRESPQTLTLIAEYDIGGMVTGADLSPDSRRLAVLTYKKIHLFDKPNDHDNYLAGRHKEINIKFGQAEGICFDGQTLVITNEEGQLLRIPSN
ncbi:MAG: hypothetical protein ACREIQ_00900 [Nitrospiria bacterium]